MRIVVTGGGTGGHYYPAVSLIDYLQKNGFEIIYIGSKNGIEVKLCNKVSYPFYVLDSKPLGISYVYNNLKAIAKALKILKIVNPQVVVGFGGYVMAPVILASIIKKTPFILHEQNVVPGRANKIFAPFARAITLGFKEAVPKINSRKVYVTGTPIRKEFSYVNQSNSREFFSIPQKSKVLLILGGSKGSTFINNLAISVLPSLLQDTNLYVIHITGLSDFKEVNDKCIKDRLENRWKVISYLENVWDAIASSQLVVTRGGGSSLAELSAFKTPAIVIPYPYAVSDHQYYNGIAYVSQYGGAVYKEKDVSKEIVFQKVQEILNSAQQLSDSDVVENASLKIMNLIRKIFP